MPDVSPRTGATGCGAIAPLLGHVVGVTGDRRFEELAGHLRSLGAVVLHGPVLHTRPVTDDRSQLRAATAAVIADPPDYLLATTGIGIRSWVNAAASWGMRSELLAALADTRVLARGPKVVGAVSEAGCQVWFSEPSGRTAAMIDHLLDHDIDGRHVVVQLPGEAMPDAVGRLRAAGARDVTTVAVYDWIWPEDLTAPRRLIRAVAEGKVSAVTFTSRPAVRNFIALAADDGRAEKVAAALRGPVRPVCIGTVTADELHALTGAEPATPASPLLGTLVQLVAAEVRRTGHRHVLTPKGVDVVVQERLVDGSGVMVMTSEREAALLDRLLGEPRRTVSRDELLRAVWSEPVDPSVLETTMARLRRRLAKTGLTILTITGRGYLLGGELVPCPGPPSDDLLPGFAFAG